MNIVNGNNFNETMKGYIIQACKIADLDEETSNKIMQGIRWATSEMTMEDARQEYKKYLKGDI